MEGGRGEVESVQVTVVHEGDVSSPCTLDASPVVDLGRAGAWSGVGLQSVEAEWGVRRCGGGGMRLWDGGEVVEDDVNERLDVNPVDLPVDQVRTPGVVWTVVPEVVYLSSGLGPTFHRVDKFRTLNVQCCRVEEVGERCEGMG